VSRLLSPGIVINAGPVPVTFGPGGFAPGLLFAGLFLEIGVRTGLSLPAAAVFGAVGGTVSLVVHEFGHAFAARKLRGVRTLGVSVVWLGAATRLEGGYLRGRDQTKVALAGPAASFALALALGALSVLPLPFQAKFFLGVLAVLNVALGAMNLIPAKPLDGYRAIVGLLWSGLGSEGAARRVIRRVALVWLPLELLGTGVLLIEKPFIGLLVFVAAAVLVVQRLYVRRAPA
jgi:Zn-dependent protease